MFHNMGPKNLKKNEEQDEKKVESKQILFNSIPFEANDAETAILLLQCKEKSILLAVLETMSEYANNSKENMQVLFNLGIVNKILPLIKHEDLFVQRFAAKLLAEMTIVEDVANYLIESDHLLIFTRSYILMTEKDTFMQEYFSSIIAKLSKDPYGTAFLAKHCVDMNFLFEKIQSSSPDVSKNNIKILNNLMQDPVGAHKISKSEKFSFSLFYQHFESPDPEIQYLALNTVADIIARNKDEDTQYLFRKTNGIKVLLNFLENEDWSDLHIEALKILNFAAENIATTNELIDIGSIPQILNYMERTIDPQLSAKVLTIFAHITNTSNGRKILHSNGIIEPLINALQRSTQSDVIEISCRAIGKMALYDPAAKELANVEIIKTILGLLKKEDLQWSVRHAASFTLKQLLRSDIRNFNIFSIIHGQDYLMQLAKQFLEQVPVEVSITILQVLIVIARHPIFRNTLINPDAVDTICLLFELTHPLADELKIACCNLLSALCLEKDGRDYFLKANGPKKLYTLITDAHSIPVRNAAVQLIQAISTDLVTADAFIERNYLSQFPVLDDIFRFKFCPLESVYVINCTEALNTSANTLKDDPILENSVDEDTNTSFEPKFGRLQCDPYLVEYVKMFKCILSAMERKDVATVTGVGSTDIQCISSRARTLARFVVRQMSGLDPENRCIDHQLEIHLREIRECLGTNVIPLGQLRVGSYLERALLFKAIADKICLPAALVRGEYGITWIEIAVPQIEDSNGRKSFDASPNENNANRSKVITVTPPELLDDSDPRTNEREGEEISLSSDDRRTMIYPIKLMRPNFIVDLMDAPGDLIPIGSPRSNLYRAKRLNRDKICC